MAGLQRSAALMLMLVTTLTTANASAKSPLRYSGYQVLKITPQTEQDAGELTQWLRDSEFDIWHESRNVGDDTDVMVSPEKAPMLISELRKRGFNTTVMIEDVQTLIQEASVGRTNGQNLVSFDWTNYHPLEKINNWLREQVTSHSKIAALISAGNKTADGRVLLGIRIAHKPNLPIVFIEAGIHAREWVSVATATWFIREALEGKSDILKSYEWHVFPTVNPDGYAYTHTEDRLWRKNRRYVLGRSKCYGADLNRNWPFEWEPGRQPCAEVFPGHNPGSEAETKGLISHLQTIAKRTRVYIALHSYGQLLMYPWAFTTTPTKDDILFGEIAKKATAKLKSLFGTEYVSGPISRTIYPAFGSSVDYVYNLNISYPFAMELRDKGSHGFLLPPNQIIPTAQETLAAVSVILEEALKK